MKCISFHHNDKRHATVFRDVTILSTKWLLNNFSHSFSISTVDLNFLPFSFIPNGTIPWCLNSQANTHERFSSPPTQILIFRYLILHLKFFLYFFSLKQAPGDSFAPFPTAWLLAAFFRMYIRVAYVRERIQLGCSVSSLRRLLEVESSLKRIMMQIKEALLLCLCFSLRTFLVQRHT